MWQCMSQGCRIEDFQCKSVPYLLETKKSAGARFPSRGRQRSRSHPAGTMPAWSLSAYARQSFTAGEVRGSMTRPRDGLLGLCCFSIAGATPRLGCAGVCKHQRATTIAVRPMALVTVCEQERSVISNAGPRLHSSTACMRRVCRGLSRSALQTLPRCTPARIP